MDGCGNDKRMDGRMDVEMTKGWKDGCGNDKRKEGWMWK